jgi:PTH1 family peptidyl-tRNA hydrolase
VADDRWLVAGLGNPESDYGGTRHNVGADAVRSLAVREFIDLARNKRTRSEVAEFRVGAQKVVLAIPMSYMNRSGDPIQATSAWFKIPADRVVVCHDDLDLPVGAIKIKRGGGHAGHNGLKDVDRALGTRDYLRIRIGIGRPPGRMPGRDFVLRKFSPADREVIDDTLATVGQAAISLVTEGLEPTQNRFHATG